jgi:hypothetical protein
MVIILSVLSPFARFSMEEFVGNTGGLTTLGRRSNRPRPFWVKFNFPEIFL